jgi:hypothetical protein
VASEAPLFFQDVIELADRCGPKNCARRGCWTNDARLGSCLRIDSSDLHDRDVNNEFHKDFVATCGHLRLRPYDATAITAFTDSAMIAVLWKNDTTECPSVARRIFVSCTSVSDVCAVIPIVNK